ncbi:MAG: hypothetical protein WD689_04675 [Gaiellaceae bacterium]
MTGTGVSLRSLLKRPVVHEGVRLGEPSDVVLDTESLRVVGVEVLCPDGALRFLPLAAARIRDDHIAVGSALLLLEEGDREFYRRRSRLFSTLVGAAVQRNGTHAGALVDLAIGSDGVVLAVRASNGAGPQTLGAEGVTIAARKASAA